jgi:hypothetical protein
MYPNNNSTCTSSTRSHTAPFQTPRQGSMPLSRSKTTTATRSNAAKTTGAFTEWMQTLRQKRGKVLFAVTVTYLDNSSSPFTKSSATRRGKRFYFYLLSRLFDRRHYNAPKYRTLQPLMVLFLDTPGSKRKNSEPQRSNSSTAPYHHHGFLALLPSQAAEFEAIARSLNAGIRDSSLLDGIQSVLVKPVEEDFAKWTRYATAFDCDEFLLLPISRAEFAAPIRRKPKPSNAASSNAQRAN